MSEQNDDSFNENTCVVCFKNVDVFSIGDCDHPVCYECSTRMRVLCRQNECPICRKELLKVIFTRNKQSYKQAEEAVGQKHILFDRKFQIVFGGPSIQHAYNSLLAHICSVCPERRAFQTFVSLRDHMRKEHELFYCELCVDNLKILTHERRCYTRKELATHKRHGDLDDRSHRGHPLCEFCDQRYNDNDDLYRHLRRDHLFCHFCDADGLHQYYDSYDVLRDHFRDHHYLCEEGECFHEKFTPVFRSEIDLKAHRASVHGRQMGKLAAKQARTLELEFTIKPRPTDQRRGGGRFNTRHQRYADDEGAVGGVEVDCQGHQQQTQAPVFSKINTESNDEFPTLGGSAAPSISQRAHFRKPGVTIRTGGKLAVNDQDFPALGPEGTASVSLRVNSVSSAERAKAKPTNVSIRVNHHPSSVTLTSAKKDPFPALQANFPSLGASKTASTPSSSSSQWVSVKSKSAPPPPVTKTVQPKSSKSYRYNESDFPAQNDFPSLGGNVPHHIARLAAAQWSSGKEPEPKLTVNKSKISQPPPKPPQPKTFHIEDDFPSLNSRFGASCSVTPDPKPLESKPKKESSISIPVNDWSKVGKSTGNTDNLSSDSDIGSKKSSKKKKNKPKSGKESSAYPEATKSANNNNNEVSKKNKQKEEPKSKAKQLKVDEHMKKQSKTEVPKSNKSEGTSEMKRTELKIDNLNGQTQPENKIILNDFTNSDSDRVVPALSQEKPAVPPGFEGTPAPPPGFSITLNSVARPPGNGLTFTSSSGQNYPIAPGDGHCNSKKSFSYVTPPNVKNRNADLVNRVNNALGSQKAYEDFLHMSALYRQSSVPAQAYYAHCRESMGEEAFNMIFPELLVLLPDIDKQRELWQAAELLKEWRLTECASCGQVIGANDLRHHQASHSLENHFPALSNGLVGPVAWPRK